MNQPPVSPSQVNQIQKLVSQIAYEGMGATATPQLLLLLEDVSAGDIVGLLFPAIVEDMTYRGICSVLAEAWETLEYSDDKRNARINLTRVHLVRARSTSGLVSRRALENAAATLDSLSARVQDWELLELKADIAVLRAKYGDAVLIYKRIPVTFRPSGEIQAKIGGAFRMDGKLDEAIQILQSSIKRESGTVSEHGRSWHELQQEQGLTYMAKGDYLAAATCLISSAMLGKTYAFAPRLDLARALSSKGNKEAVKVFIDSIVAWNRNLNQSALHRIL